MLVTFFHYFIQAYFMLTLLSSSPDLFQRFFWPPALHCTQLPSFRTPCAVQPYGILRFSSSALSHLWALIPGALLLERSLSLSALTPTCSRNPTGCSLSQQHPQRPIFSEPVHACYAWLQFVLLNVHLLCSFPHTGDSPECSFTIPVTAVYFERWNLESILLFIMKTVKEDVRSTLI